MWSWWIVWWNEHERCRNEKRMKIALFLCLIACTAAAAEVYTGLEYAAPTNGTARTLDVGVPEGDGPFPIVLYIHGGGWSSGDKGEVSLLTNALQAVPAVWFSLDYRLAPTNRWPACLEDVNAAIRWVKAHAADYKGDPNRVALIGYSAGGHLATLAAVQGGDDTRVQAVVGLAAPTDHIADSERRGGLSRSMQMLLDHPPALDPAVRSQLRDLSPLNYVRPGLPPFLLMAGTQDRSVPYSQSVNFSARLRQAQVPCDLVTLTNAQHRIGDWKQFDADYQLKLVDWLRTVLGIPSSPQAR